MDILIKPVLTEKMTAITEKLGHYAFVVNKNANKLQVKTAIEKMYGVNVESVNTMRYAGKAKARHTKTGYVQGKTNAYKKAIITLQKGESIDFFSNI